MILIVLFIIIFGSYNNGAEADNIDPDIQNKIYQVMEKQQKIKTFQTDADLNIEAYSQKSSFNFTYYYHEPNRVHLDTENFVLLPTEPLKSLQPSFFKLSNYQIDFIGSTNHKGEKLNRIQLTPKKENNKFWIKIWINTEKEKIEKAKIFFTMPSFEKEFALNVQYQLINGFSMPVTVKGHIAIPTRIKMNGQIKDFQEGLFDLTLSNYRINQEFPPDIMRKL